MSSISSSQGRSSQDDIIRSQRESNQERETQLQKKHARELRSVNEAHQNEINALKETYAHQIDDLKERSQKAISERDGKYQREISDIRNMHRKNLQRYADDTYQQQQILKHAHDQDVAKAEQISDQKIQRLAQANSESLKQLESNLTEVKDTAAESQKLALDRQRKTQQDHFQTEKEALVSGFETKNQGLTRENQELRKTYGHQAELAERRHQEEKKSIHGALSATIKNNEAINKTNLELQRQGFSEEADRIKAKYWDASAEKEQKRDIDLMDYNRTVMNRIDQKSRSYEQQIADEKLERHLEDVRRTRTFTNEKQNLKDNLGRQIRALEKDRAALVKQSSSVNNREVSEAKKQGETMVRDTSQFYREKLGDERIRFDEMLNQERDRSEFENQRTKDMADKHVKTLRAYNIDNQRKLQGDFESQSATLKELYREKLNEERRLHFDERRSIEKRYIGEIRGLQQKHNQELETQRGQLEQKMAEQSEKDQGEIRRLSKLNSQQVKNLRKLHQMEMDTRESKYQEQMAQLRDRYDRELESMERRHQAQMGELGSNIKKA